METTKTRPAGGLKSEPTGPIESATNKLPLWKRAHLGGRLHMEPVAQQYMGTPHSKGRKAKRKAQKVARRKNRR